MRFKTVCCVCRRVKSDNNKWNLETYNPDTASHGYCEECAAVLMDRIADRKAMLLGETRLPG